MTALQEFILPVHILIFTYHCAKYDSGTTRMSFQINALRVKIIKHLNDSSVNCSVTGLT